MRRPNSWHLHLLYRALAYRKGRTALLVAVLAMAASLVTAFLAVSASINSQVAVELNRYGANMILQPVQARLDIGSGGFAFGSVAQPASLSQQQVEDVLLSHGKSITHYSLHLSGAVQCQKQTVPAEGVRFDQIRKLFPWWQVSGKWPTGEETAIGSNLAERLGIKPGMSVKLAAAGKSRTCTVSAVISTGGEEDSILFVPLALFQEITGQQDMISQARLVVRTDVIQLSTLGRQLQQALPGTVVHQIRQVAKTSARLLSKVRLLLFLVTMVVLGSAAGSVASTISATVLERRQEIGLMKTLGGTSSHIAYLFLAEVVFIAIVGGIVGFCLGSGLAWLIGTLVFDAPTHLRAHYVVPALGVSLGLAIFGSGSALFKVTRLATVQSLRVE